MPKYYIACKLQWDVVVDAPTPEEAIAKATDGDEVLNVAINGGDVSADIYDEEPDDA